MRVLLTRVQGGLCNRLRVILGADLWARTAGRTLFVTWPAEPHFGAALDDLWVTPLRQSPSRVTSVAARLAGGYRLPRDVALDDPSRLLVVSTWDVFRDGSGAVLPWWESLGMIRPTDEISERIRTQARTFRDGMVGVMIRAHETSHRNTLEASPVAWFVTRMAQLRALDPDVTFFLSTDVPEVSREIHARFSGVQELPGKSGYNTKAGVKDAVCDLYLLAGCTYILGSHYSSFSDTASLLSGHGGYETSRTAPAESWQQRAAAPTRPPIS